MHFWSEGLGDSELVMGLGLAKLDRTGDFVVLSGIVESPAPWEYEVKVQFDDWVAILRTATSKEACDFIASHMSVRALFGMAWTIVKFILLLAAYRFIRLIGLAPPVVSSISGVDKKRTAQSQT